MRGFREARRHGCRVSSASVPPLVLSELTDCSLVTWRAAPAERRRSIGWELLRAGCELVGDT